LFSNGEDGFLATIELCEIKRKNQKLGRICKSANECDRWKHLKKFAYNAKTKYSIAEIDQEFSQEEKCAQTSAGMLGREFAESLSKNCG